MMIHWTNIAEELWDRLYEHINDELTYMVVVFDSGCKVQLDYLAHLRYKIVVDIRKYENNDSSLLESCLINEENKVQSYMNLNALFEGTHYDDQVEFIKLIFSSNDGDIQYVFDGERWSKFVNNFGDQSIMLEKYYGNGILSKEELKDLAILDSKNLTL